MSSPFKILSWFWRTKQSEISTRETWTRSLYISIFSRKQLKCSLYFIGLCFSRYFLFFDFISFASKMIKRKALSSAPILVSRQLIYIKYQSKITGQHEVAKKQIALKLLCRPKSIGAIKFRVEPMLDQYFFAISSLLLVFKPVYIYLRVCGVCVRFRRNHGCSNTAG